MVLNFSIKLILAAAKLKGKFPLRTNGYKKKGSAYRLQLPKVSLLF
jgi:hypothetical protein